METHEAVRRLRENAWLEQLWSGTESDIRAAIDAVLRALEEAQHGEALLENLEQELVAENHAIYMLLDGPPREGLTLPQELRARYEEQQAEIAQLRADLAAEVADNVSLRERHVTQEAADQIKRLEDRLIFREEETDQLIKQAEAELAAVRTAVVEAGWRHAEVDCHGDPIPLADDIDVGKSAYDFLERRADAAEQRAERLEAALMDERHEHAFAVEDAEREKARACRLSVANAVAAKRARVAEANEKALREALAPSAPEEKR